MTSTFTTLSQWNKLQQDKIKPMIFDGNPFMTSPGVDELTVYKTGIVTALTMVPYGPVVSGIADVFLTYLIETFNEDKSIIRYQTLCNDLIQNSLYQYDDNQTKAIFKACSLAFKDYRQHWKELQADPKNEALKEVMRVSFQNLENEIATKYIYQCRKGGFEVNELVLFSMFATDHLIILRDCIYSGNKEWGMHPDSVKIYSDKFNKLIVDYAEYCVTTYNQGITTISKRPEANMKMRWNRLNRWRNYNIICVFDFVNLWFAMDPKVNEQGVCHTPVRYLFSDIMGTPYNSVDDNHQMTPAKINEKIAANNYHLYQNELKKVEYSIEDRRFRSFQPFFHSENSADGFRPGILVSGTRDPKLNPIVAVNLPITNDYSVATIKNGYFMMNCKLTAPPNANAARDVNAFPWTEFNTFCTTRMVECELRWRTPGTWSDPEAVGQPFENVKLSFEGHKIGNIFSLSVNSYSDFTNKLRFMGGACDCFIFAFLPEQVFHQNIIPKVGNTLLDAQKYTTTDTAKLAYDYFYPGVHAMRVPAEGMIQIKLIPEDETQTVYQVKIRCDVKKQTSLKVQNKTTNTAEQEFYIPRAVNKTLATSTLPATDVFKIDIGKTGSLIQFTATTDEIYIQSILLIPVVTTTAKSEEQKKSNFSTL
ncbi:hypothetical protein PPL_09637 [Heterostelium album PN500]|uniref:Pesticidal crystal protein domain-containing protein n=1 Tax=Heterostelium pallidum (strain ATCC 26659 / Pp 5 / PN500) TaxID=670386 RepID=D3BNW6_HETP5|nr:hypothetical protein PPL_09637 [Heterostelium album PN500]EFA76885.1 hypothetical protein PPL_09637 [Heterostelium album PN500]|eukprot:XP_020429017.1 hypothetical protein PPL_09637 [Heterostelium album PN500]